jgi:hypothetical protein
MNLKEKLKDDKKVIRMVSDELGILQRGGFDMICPIVPPMQVRQRTQNQLTGAVQEQIGFQKNSCNTNCPLMEIGDNYVILKCGSESIKHEITKIIDVDDIQTNDSKIINIGKGGTA